MGWASGSGLCADIVKQARKHVPESARPAFYKALIDIFESEDCDTLQEVSDKEFAKEYRKVMRKRYPDDYCKKCSGMLDNDCKCEGDES